MRIPIATIVLALGLMPVSAALAADEAGLIPTFSGTTLGVAVPAWTIQFGQTAPPGNPAPSQPATRPETASGESVLTLEEALAIALADNRGVKTATLEVGRARDRIGAAQTRRYPAFRVGVDADYP